jgi:hypothetical protein
MSNSKADERAVLAILTAPFEGPERYRPMAHRPRYGLRAQLRVRLDDTHEGWTEVTRWYATEAERADAVVQLQAGLGLYGQQARAGRLRRPKLVSR